MASLNPNIDHNSVKILVVDDIPLNIMLIDKMMGIHHLKTQQAHSGVQALDMIAQDCPHIVLLDLIMPEMDGYQVISKIRETYTKEELPIVVLSALNANDNIVKAMKLGANDYITKPVIAERLFNIVFALLNTKLAQ